MANIRKRTVSISAVLRAAAFRDGYEAAAKGIPFDPDAYKGERYHGFSATCLYESRKILRGALQGGTRSLHPA
jgi:hypothetical protein